jgi:hypothetical protein
MLLIETIFLVICAFLCIAAIASFLCSFRTAGLLLLLANIAAAVGALEIVLTTPIDGLATWAVLFASGAFSCGAIAMRQLKDRPIRWVHRFVIYAGYAATLAAISIAAVWLHAQDSSGVVCTGVLLGTILAGSACIFLAKTLVVRIMVKRMPEYLASVKHEDQQYW